MNAIAPLFFAVTLAIAGVAAAVSPVAAVAAPVIGTLR